VTITVIDICVWMPIGVALWTGALFLVLALFGALIAEAEKRKKKSHGP
jgi:hypothetical protein